MKYTLIVLFAILFQANVFAGRISVGDRVSYVQNGTHYRAVVVALYQNRTAKIRFPDGEFLESTVNISSITTLLEHSDRFYVNQNVSYTQNGSIYEAQILEIYEDGHARIRFPKGEFLTSVVKLQSLQPSAYEVGGFVVGDRVVYKQNGSRYEARIEGLYENGKAKISFPNGEFLTSTIDIASIAKLVNMLGRFQTNDSVVYTQNGSHYQAVILGLYQDGSARIQFPNGEFLKSFVGVETLGKEVRRIQGLRKGDEATYEQNGTYYEAVILALYDSGIAYVQFPRGEFLKSMVNISSLSKTVTTIEQ